ncbi:hypothetical protein BATDEDRAFT_85063 [Batrachochytrium dendrobatidis JAM81]|uniref:Nuclear speckle splicing regulatory protein 1 N-terminal domain-containing protein n=2 Tax=Batrachochytrium dendrobatidis TaxID=109871 RepID=F4NTL1_BATDJ|nr:uncharacterized protein BATDEDRAFT_85063 [Batrachochytrium dendrobatidis JAM81]EGF84343.1 hypothetical protein BATDEDRAFT_85063 [Batrachochytrium dendrobatidis JAM81]KAJ8327156.1 hypothetical protein O5D80_004568 [Batrachochytrium dendrobatidis]KAK5667940.1 hypothetical protein QVD99_004989 [Batrachochytrium dendrobatidis]OAJ37252.1 hypothetical protein BDEG_21297 [Batrachochytrium dendrobatidis JEL423]|eukprot:XP_006676411.1 hypothetical protein BATDEDRAFT_85063 [Batrachochytrium dendrobatidis JAM81]
MSGKPLQFGLNVSKTSKPLAVSGGKLSFTLGRKKVANPLAGQERDSDEEQNDTSATITTIQDFDSVGSNSHDRLDNGADATRIAAAEERERNRLASKLEQQRVNAELRAIQAKQVAAVEIAEQLAKESDPTLFDYDTAYDYLKEASLIKQRQRDGANDDSIRKKPRYIEALLSASSKRKIELERAEERKIQREREEDGDKFGEKDMFVTEAYLQRKEELRKIEEEEKRKEETEANNRDMTGFYKNILERQEADAVDLAKIAALAAQNINDDTGKHKLTLLDEALETERLERERQRQILESGNIIMNDFDEIVDKRQLLAGGLNLTVKTLKQIELERKESEERKELELKAKQSRDAEQRAQRVRAQRAREQANRSAKASLQQQEQKKQEAAEEAEQNKARLEVMAASKVSDIQVQSARDRYLARKKADESK